MEQSTHHEVVIVVFDGVQSLDATGPLEVFAGAARARGSRYRVRTASLGGAVAHASSGVGLVPSVALEDLGWVDTLVVAGGQGAHDPDPALVEVVRQVAGRSGRVASVCSGAFVLAHAGLLEGLVVTTHWRHCDRLAAEFPGVRVERDPVFVRSGRVWTSAGVTSGIDLALAVVEEDLGREVALSLARNLVVFLARPGGQAQFSTQLATQRAERAEVRAVQHLVDADPGRGWSLAVLAERAGLSVRQFSRVFAEQVGATPGRYVERVRVEWARRRLEEGSAPVVAIARGCGFGTAEAMRRAFVRTLGCAPAEYRERFRVGAGSAGRGSGG
ncbi:GlxA family transcriptional regulator [Nocardiopsis nanhaiensis]